jgi:DNA modification methylase
MGKVIYGDALETLKTLPDESVQCVVTSPPYYGMRDYGFAGQIGLEPTLAEYLAKIVAVFSEIHRILRPDGTLWVNIGDGYFGDSPVREMSSEAFSKEWDKTQTRSRGGRRRSARREGSLKAKDLLGLPWRIAFALQDSGWWLRSDIIWAKPNPMPESVSDRPTKSHEYLFLLSRSSKYFYDAEAIMEPVTESSMVRLSQATFDTQTGGPKDPRNSGDGNQNRSARRALENMRRKVGPNSHEKVDRVPRSRKPFPEESRSVAAERLGSYPGWRKDGRPIMRNKRSVWTISTTPYPGAHFATFPEALVTPCILAGSRPGDVVLDPFAGSGTTLAVAVKLGRDYIGIEGKKEYIELIEKRLSGTTQGMAI